MSNKDKAGSTLGKFKEIDEKSENKVELKEMFNELQGPLNKEENVKVIESEVDEKYETIKLELEETKQIDSNHINNKSIKVILIDLIVKLASKVFIYYGLTMFLFMFIEWIAPEFKFEPETFGFISIALYLAYYIWEANVYVLLATWAGWVWIHLVWLGDNAKDTVTQITIWSLVVLLSINTIVSIVVGIINRRQLNCENIRNEQ